MQKSWLRCCWCGGCRWCAQAEPVLHLLPLNGIKGSLFSKRCVFAFSTNAQRVTRNSLVNREREGWAIFHVWKKKGEWTAVTGTGTSQHHSAGNKESPVLKLPLKREWSWVTTPQSADNSLLERQSCFPSELNAAWERLYPTPPPHWKGSKQEQQQLPKPGLASALRDRGRRLQTQEHCHLQLPVSGTGCEPSWCCAEPDYQEWHQRTFPAMSHAWVGTKKKYNPEPVFLIWHFPIQRKVLTPSSAGDLFFKG